MQETREMRVPPWVGKTPWRRAWQPTPVSLPGESGGQRSLVGYRPWGHKESDTTGHVYTVLDFPQMWSSSQMLKHHVALKQRRIWYKVPWKSVCLYCKHFKQTGAGFPGDTRFQKATKPRVWASLKDMSATFSIWDWTVPLEVMDCLALYCCTPFSKRAITPKCIHLVRPTSSHKERADLSSICSFHLGDKVYSPKRESVWSHQEKAEYASFLCPDSHH